MDARDLRVSDAEREHVGRILQSAVGQGMLSLGEFTERMDTALAAKTRAELNIVLVDLPGVRLVGAETANRGYNAPQPNSGPQQPQPTVAHGERDVVRGRMSGLSRKGQWHVPATLFVSTKMSSVTLDFTEAVVSTQVVEVIVDDFASSVSLIVPPNATVDMNGLDLVGASANNKVRTGPPVGALHLVVRGRMRFGSVTAKHPFGTGWRRLLGQSE